jgi:Tse6 toxin immunity protein Tsi6
MPSSPRTFEEFDALLADACAQVQKMAEAEPHDGAIASVKRQLDAVHAWTRGGRSPTQDEKDQLNFGLIASRELDNYPVAASLYELASYVIWWGER